MVRSTEDTLHPGDHMGEKTCPTFRVWKDNPSPSRRQAWQLFEAGSDVELNGSTNPKRRLLFDYFLAEKRLYIRCKYRGFELRCEVRRVKVGVGTRFSVCHPCVSAPLVVVAVQFIAPSDHSLLESMPSPLTRLPPLASHSSRPVQQTHHHVAFSTPNVQP